MCHSREISAAATTLAFLRAENTLLCALKNCQSCCLLGCGSVPCCYVFPLHCGRTVGTKRRLPLLCGDLAVPASVRQAMAPEAAEPVTASDAQHPPVVIKLPGEALRRIQQAEQKFANAHTPQGSVPGEVLHGHGEDDEAPMEVVPAAATSNTARSASASAASKGKKPDGAG